MNSIPDRQSRVTLRAYADGPIGAENFAIEEGPVPAPGEGEFLVRIFYASVEPMLRITVDARPLGMASPWLPLGAVIPGPAVGEVVRSNHPDFAVGDRVEGRFGWQEYAVSKGNGVQRVGAGVEPLYNALGVYGLPGFTAWIGIRRMGGVQPGQTVLVSGAGGAVGSVVGPLVAMHGGRAVGIASGKEKQAELVRDYGYAAVADRSAPDFLDQLKAAVPEGVDVYFDNVGGPLMATVATLLKPRGRIMICGLMSQYQGHDGPGTDHLPPLMEALMARSASIQAFSQVGEEALRPEFEREIGVLIASGALRTPVHVEEGISALPTALCGLFEQSRTGKVVVRVAPDPAAVQTDGIVGVQA